MANDITIPAGMNVSTKFAQSKVSHDDLGAGIIAGFAVVSYKGKVWRVKHRGEEKMLMRPDEPGVPQAFIDCVIVKASPAIAKIYYKGTYSEGDMAPPDCWSVNGVAPDPAAPDKQSTTCAGCPMNAWGSKVTANGRATKACQDSKRLAIVPANDMVNELHGGPMLLRVPPASLADLSQYGSKLKQISADYFSVVTRIGFDVNEAYPKFTFAATRGLNDEEADIILPLQEDARVTRILQEAVDNVRADAAGAPAPAPKPAATPAPAAKPAAAPAAKPAATVPDPLEIPEHLRRAPPVTKAAPAPAPDPKEEEIAALRAKLAALQGGAANGTAAPAATPATVTDPNTGEVTPVVKRTRNKATTPTVAPPSPAPTPEPVAAQPAAQPASQATQEALTSIENELDALL